MPRIKRSESLSDPELEYISQVDAKDAMRWLSARKVFHFDEIQCRASEIIAENLAKKVTGQLDKGIMLETVTNAIVKRLEQVDLSKMINDAVEKFVSDVDAAEIYREVADREITVSGFGAEIRKGIRLALKDKKFMRDIVIAAIADEKKGD